MEDINPVAVSERIAQSDKPLEEKLRLHLQGNMSIIVPTEMIPVCIQAIEMANQGADRNQMLDLPEGVWYKGEVKANIQQIIDGHRLEFFIDGYEVLHG